MQALSEQVSTATFAKVMLVFGGVSTALTYAAANIPLDELPKVEPHTALDTVIIGLVTWLIRMKVTERSHNPRDAKESTSSLILSRLEDMAFGVKKTAEELSDHRIQFSGVSEKMSANFENLEKRIDRVEDRVDGLAREIRK